MKRSIALHFAKCMHATQNPDSKLLRQNLKHLVKVYTIDIYQYFFIILYNDIYLFGDFILKIF